MAIISGHCASFKQECLRAIHDFSADIIMAALYTSAASLGPLTTAYSTTNEATGDGWPAGGIAMSVRSTYPKYVRLGDNRYAGVVAFEDAVAPSVTVTFRAVLLYNLSKANRAIAVLDKGIDTFLLNGPLTLLNNPNAPYLITIA